MSRFFITAVALIVTAIALPAQTGKPIELTALVIDTGCYLSHDTKGEKHVRCATACAKAGVPLALLDEKSGTVYLPIAQDHKNQNLRLMPFIEKKVKVSGTLHEKAGVKGIVIKTVEAEAN